MYFFFSFGLGEIFLKNRGKIYTFLGGEWGLISAPINHEMRALIFDENFYVTETGRLSVDEEAENLPPRSSLGDNNLLSPTLVSSVSPYHRVSI